MSNTTIRGTVRTRTFPSQPVILPSPQRPQYLTSEAPPPYQECLVHTPCTCRPMTTLPHQSRHTASSTTYYTCAKGPSIWTKIFCRRRSEPRKESPGRYVFETQSSPSSPRSESACQAHVSKSTADMSQPYVRRYQVCQCRNKDGNLRLRSSKPTSAYRTQKGVTLMVWRSSSGPESYGCCPDSSRWTSESLDLIRRARTEQTATK